MVCYGVIAGVISKLDQNGWGCCHRESMTLVRYDWVVLFGILNPISHDIVVQKAGSSTRGWQYTKGW